MSTHSIRNVVETIRRSPSATTLLLVSTQALVLLVPLGALPLLHVAPHVAFVAAIDVVSLLLILAAVTWWIFARPFEAGLRENRRALRSLFIGNPESIAVYGLDGFIRRGNAAAADMMKQPAEALIGAHFSKHVAPELVATTQAAFDVAVGGGKIAFETVFIGGNQERIPVRSTLFPHIVNDSVVGVFGVAKDIGELQRANAAAREQAQRIHELYEVSASAGRSWKEQIDDALSLLCRRLASEGAALIEVVEDDNRLIACVGEEHFADSVDAATLQRAIETTGVACLPCPDPARRWLVAPMALGEGRAGVLGLVTGAHVVLSDSDRDFVRLVTSLVAAAHERGRQQDRLDKLAFYDALTGLPNLVMVTDRLAELLCSAKWRGQAFAVHYVDLDRFKEVNDGYGHATGDQILRMAARRMQTAVGPEDIVARLGGDEFVIVQPSLADIEDAKTLALRILAAIAQPFGIDGVRHQLGVSIGISIAPNDGCDSQTLLQRADEALYRAKREGRNRLEFAFENAELVMPGIPAGAV